MTNSERTRQNVIVFPAPTRGGERVREDAPHFRGVDPYGDGANLDFAFENAFIARHFGEGWRGVVSTGLTAAVVALLVAILCVYC